MKMEPIVSSETSAIRTQTPGNYPKRNKLQRRSYFIFYLIFIINLYIIIHISYDKLFKMHGAYIKITLFVVRFGKRTSNPVYGTFVPQLEYKTLTTFIVFWKICLNANCSAAVDFTNGGESVPKLVLVKWHCSVCLLQLAGVFIAVESRNVMAHAQKPDFVFRAKRTSLFKSARGVSSVDYSQPRCAHQR